MDEHADENSDTNVSEPGGDDRGRPTDAQHVNAPRQRRYGVRRRVAM